MMFAFVIFAIVVAALGWWWFSRPASSKPAAPTDNGGLVSSPTAPNPNVNVEAQPYTPYQGGGGSSLPTSNNPYYNDGYSARQAEPGYTSMSYVPTGTRVLS